MIVARDGDSLMRSFELRLWLTERIESYAKEIENLWRHLPEEAEELRCLNYTGGTLVEIAFLGTGSAEEEGAKLRSTLAAFEQWEINEQIGMTAAKMSNLSPSWAWKDKHLRGGSGWKPRNPNHVPLTERWKRRGASPA